MPLRQNKVQFLYPGNSWSRSHGTICNVVIDACTCTNGDRAGGHAFWLKCSRMASREPDTQNVFGEMVRCSLGKWRKVF